MNMADRNMLDIRLCSRTASDVLGSVSEFRSDCVSCANNDHSRMMASIRHSRRPNKGLAC